MEEGFLKFRGRRTAFRCVSAVSVALPEQGAAVSGACQATRETHLRKGEGNGPTAHTPVVVEWLSPPGKSW